MDCFIISDKIKAALNEKQPVVALESSVIAQGMPYPYNLNTAIQMQNIIKSEGAVPAVIGFIDGKIIIGLSDKQVEFLATGKNLAKIARQDISYVAAKGLSGGTTVSASIFLASKAGIDVFATGGIGGVHKDFNDSFDISQDLDVLGKTGIVTVSSGAKSIVDLPKTLEYLETKSVLVLGYKTNNLPAFYSKESGLNLLHTVNNAEEAAKIYLAQSCMGINSCVLVANPVPEEKEIPFEEMTAIINEAVEQAIKDNIHGKAVTPYLLSKIADKTEGKSLQTNISLLENNALVGALIAKEVSRLKQMNQGVI